MAAQRPQSLSKGFGRPVRDFFFKSYSGIPTLSMNKKLFHRKEFRNIQKCLPKER